MKDYIQPLKKTIDRFSESWKIGTKFYILCNV